MNNLVAKKIIKIKNEEKEIQIYKLPASEGIVMGTKILKLILPVLGGFADEMFSEETKEVPKTFSEISTRLVTQMDNVDILGIIKRLLSELAINRKEVDFDNYFMGNYGELILVVEFALRENFNSFFEVVGLKDRLLQVVGAVTDNQAESDEQ